MYKGKKIACVVPARLRSTRFEEKVLCKLQNKPILQWIFESAKKSELIDEIIFAVDAKKTKDLVESFQGKALMTSERCPSGTDRLIEIKDAYEVEADVFVNWQADEPFIDTSLLLDLLQSIDDDADVWTLKKKIETEEELNDTSCVKVVVDAFENALYFSRYAIPFVRNEASINPYKHLGIYAYSAKALDKIRTLPVCELEKAESLEQLRFLYNGMKIKVHTTAKETLGIDEEKHLLLAEKLVNSSDSSFVL